MKLVLIIVGVVGVLVIVFKLFMRWHMKWLDNQSPVGVWTGENEGNRITIQFDRDPTPDEKEGLYRQLTETGDRNGLKEFGHWWTHRQTLRMMIMASEIPSHPRFGQDTVYHISYTGPEEITIDGPDRPRLVYRRAPEGTTVVFTDEKGIEPTDGQLSSESAPSAPSDEVSS